MRAQPTTIKKRVFSDIPAPILKGILKELRAGRSVGATARMFDMNDKFVTRIRDDAGIPAKKNTNGYTKTPDPIV